MDGSSEKVYLYVYDLTQGMAKSLSPMLIGRQIEGIWHSAIVVFGKEYFFGDGICNMSPGTTPFGVPTKKEYLGDTEITEDLFMEFLGEIKDRFSPINYNVKSHNCNHFTNECSNFLIGSDIPHNVLKQAEDLFNTPLGKMVEPMVIQQQDALKQGSNNMFGSSSGAQSNLSGAMGGMSLGGQTAGNDPKLIEVTSLSQVQDLISIYPGVVIDCWSPTCPPCVQFKPTFKQMAEYYGSDKVKFITVNTKEAPEVAMNFMVTSIPAFFIYKNGECIDNFVGANKSKLEGLVKTLKSDLGDESTGGVSNVREAPTIIRVKPDLGFIQFKPLSKEPILFENNTEKTKDIFVNKIVPKVKEIIDGVSEDHKEEISNIKQVFDQGFKLSNIDVDEMKQVLDVISICEEKSIFVIFDFLRCIVCSSKQATIIANEAWESFDKALSRVESLIPEDQSSLPKEVQNAQLTSSQMICNLFKTKDFYTNLFDDQDKVVRIMNYASKVVNSPRDKAVSAAASVALNIMIAFDIVDLAPLEDDKSIDFETKQVALEQCFEKYEDGFRAYCESATTAYPSQENEDALYRLIMSECRILHANDKLNEQLAGNDEYLKARMRITQKYPTGRMNESVQDIQKILTSYVK